MPLLDFIFPPKCVACGALGVSVCVRCLSRVVPYHTEYPCPDCGRGTAQWSVCDDCTTLDALDGLFVACAYGGVIEEALHAYKYDRVMGVEVYLVEILQQAVQVSATPSIDLVTWVPMKKEKQIERGFNQAERLAKSLPGEQWLTLEKTADRPAQMTLDKKERRRNAQGVYRCMEPGIVIGKTIVIVDDVCTTGSTLNECARVLKDAGALGVYGCVLAHGGLTGLR